MKQSVNRCGAAAKCGSCQYQNISYHQQLQKKQELVASLLSSFCDVEPIIGMTEPYHYRNKVHHVFTRDRRGQILSGTYQAGTHRVVPIEHCMIEDKLCQEIILTIHQLLRSFKLPVYNEDTGTGLLRHVLVRRGFATGQIMVVLVLGSPVFPSKNNFIKALRKAHPQITTIICNVNGRRTSMVLGEHQTVAYGPGYIKDVLCGRTFRISPKSFYQVNPIQTELLYNTAMKYAGLDGSQTVIDAYCGIGTIALAAAGSAKSVIGVELNPDAVRDAILNAKENQIENARFIQADAGQFMTGMAEKGQRPDVVFMDPPRAGSDEAFLCSLTKLKPRRIVYISCNPLTLKRDLEYLVRNTYQVQRIQPVDMFPWTEHVETCVLLQKNN